MADKRENPRGGRRRLDVQRIGLLRAVALTLVGLAVAGVVVWTLFTRLLRGYWPWQVGALDESTPGKDTTQIVLTVIAGLGAAVALVVAYRRQRDAELARFDERFAAAAAQLGAGTAAERLAGVYAMAALADTWQQHRQQCIDVLCGYLRLPYDPTNALLKTVVSEHTWPIGTATGKETRTYEQLPNDRQVRLTIISTITHHLCGPADGGAPISNSWQGKNFDFTGATFDGGDFSGAIFSGGRVSFGGATFSGGQVTFDRAQFIGGQVTFLGATFSGGLIDFGGATFSGGLVNFVGATFSGGLVTFGRAQFSVGQVTFSLARFTGGRVDFTVATFSGGRVDFAGATFSGGQVNFDGATFSGGQVNFDGATFSGGQVNFDGATFTGGFVGFYDAEFYGGHINFDRATFTDGQLNFNAATFAGGVVTRYGAEFRGWPSSDPDPEPSEDHAG